MISSRCSTLLMKSLDPLVSPETQVQLLPVSSHTQVRASRVCSVDSNPEASYRRPSNNQIQACPPLFSNHRARVARRTPLRSERTLLAASPGRVPDKALRQSTPDAAPHETACQTADKRAS